MRWLACVRDEAEWTPISTRLFVSARDAAKYASEHYPGASAVGSSRFRASEYREPCADDCAEPDPDGDELRWFVHERRALDRKLCWLEDQILELRRFLGHGQRLVRRDETRGPSEQG